MNQIKKKILEISIADVTLQSIGYKFNKLMNSTGKITVFGINPHSFNFSFVDEEFKRYITEASIAYPEGIGTIIASRMLGTPLSQKTTLMDFIYKIFKLAERKKWSVFILGGKKNICSKASENLQKQFPKLKIVGFNSGYFNKEQEREIIKKINKKEPKIVFVAMGTPKQELWIGRNLKKINAKAFFGIGGSIDVIAGKSKRAPNWMHKNGLEWFYRLFKDPSRLWKRYIIGNLIFVLIVILVLLKINLAKQISKKFPREYI